MEDNGDDNDGDGLALGIGLRWREGGGGLTMVVRMALVGGALSACENGAA